jgi:surfactin synthase thioesterase subunit
MVTVTAQEKEIRSRRQGISAIHLTFFGTLATQLNRNESLSRKADFQLFPKTIKFTGVTPEILRYFNDR